MPIQNDKVSLDFYRGTAQQVANVNATKGHVYLDTDNNNVYIGASDNKVKAANGVYKLNDTVIVDGTSLKVGNTTMSETDLKFILDVSKLNLANQEY